MKTRFLFILVLLSMMACKQDKPATSSAFEINIRLNRDPQRVHPVFSPSSIGREVFQYIFLPLADFHPEDLKLHPILIEQVPQSEAATDSTNVFEMNIREEASWSDGTPITAEDYAFTIKTVLHPLCKATGWKPYFEFFKEVTLDSDKPKNLKVYIDNKYMLARELAVTINLLPRHIYDPENLLANYSISEINKNNPSLQDSVHVKLFNLINNSANQKTDMVQCGPYKMTSYENEQYIILERQDSYWGNKIKGNPFLENNPQKLIFRIVPDELTAINMAKENKLDLLTLSTSNTYLELKDDESISANWSFQAPQLIRHYYIALNNKQGLLEDVNLRRALAHLADVDDYMQNIDGGLGIRTIGHFHPSRQYYNNELEPVPYDVEKAKNILSETGWEDNNNDGVREKKIGNTTIDLELDILITGSQLSKNMALLLQESAKQAGVRITLTQKSTALMRKENITSFNYDMVMLSAGQDEAPDDPYSKWHSDNAVPGGGNFMGYINPESDKLIEQIRKSTNDDERKPFYLALQNAMYKDQPAIFLYCPLKKMMIHKRLSGLATTKRPGYLANTFTLTD
ncbi:MAG: hypothetical protein KJO29_08625 [Bacteroidia bacterium]|nr:hypothetical protein [Bacteroidia bacterium]